MKRLSGKMRFLVLVAVLTALRPSKPLFPHFWKRWFGLILCGAASLGYRGIVRYLLWLSPEVDARETMIQATPLMSAAYAGHLEVARDLLARGADVNATHEWGGTALMWSAEFGHLALTKFLIESGAEVNARTVHGDTAFIAAAKLGQTAMLQVLLDHGAEMLAAGPGTMDALVWAAGLGQTHTVEFLLKQGMSVVGKRGERALMLALHNKRTQIVSLLQQAGAVEPTS